MKAQKLYDFREKFEFCDGKELADFFRQELGDPSPGGSANINTAKAKAFVSGCLDTMAANSPSLASHVQEARAACAEL